MGGAFGLVLAVVGVRLLQSIGAGATIPRLAEVRIDGVGVDGDRVIAAAAAVLVSVLPLLRVGRMSLASVLAAHSPSTPGGRVRHRARRALVVAQVALALMLLAGAGLFARSFAQPARRESRASTRDSARRSVSRFPSRISGGERRRAGRDGTLDALRALPGVQAVGVTTKLPLDDEARQDSAVFVEDQPLQPGEIPGIHGWRS